MAYFFFTQPLPVYLKPVHIGSTYTSTAYTYTGCNGAHSTTSSTLAVCGSSGTYAETCFAGTSPTSEPTVAPTGPSPAPSPKPTPAPVTRTPVAPTLRPSGRPTTGPTTAAQASGYYFQYSFTAAAASCNSVPNTITVFALGVCYGTGSSYRMLSLVREPTTGSFSVSSAIYVDTICTIRSGVAAIVSNFSTACAGSVQFGYSQSYPVLPASQYYALRSD